MLKHYFLIAALCLFLFACGGEKNNQQNTDTAANVPETYFIEVNSHQGQVLGLSENCTASCTMNYTAGTALELTASPNAGYEFLGWSGACVGINTCSITVTEAITITANFAPTIEPLFSVSVSWTIPEKREDESILTTEEISAYEINYTRTDDNFSANTVVNDASATHTLIDDLPVGHYQFRILTIDTQGVRSLLSDPFSTTLGP